MKVSDRTLLWAAWLMLVIGFIWDNNRLRDEIDNLKDKIEFQEQVMMFNYENIHKLSHEADSLWIYK